MADLDFISTSASQWADELEASGVNRCAALQALTVTGCSSIAAGKAYLAKYTYPLGANRGAASTIQARHRHPYAHALTALLETIDCFSAPGTAYDYDAKADPAQIYEWPSGRTIKQLADSIISAAASIGTGSLSYTKKLCALYDYIKENITYATETDLRGTATNYWATAAETLYLKKGCCKLQAILFGALVESQGYVSRQVCIPGHALSSVLVDPSQFVADEVGEWYHAKHTEYRPSAYPVHLWHANGRTWVMADLTMAGQLGAMSGSNLEDFTGSGPRTTWRFPLRWIQEVGGQSVTYRYCSDKGCRFEWAASSTVDGAYKDCQGTISRAGVPSTASPTALASVGSAATAPWSSTENEQERYDHTWVVTTTGRGGGVASYNLEFWLKGVDTEPVQVVGRIRHSATKHVAVRGLWSSKTRKLSWTELHVAAGTYDRDYNYECTLPDECLSAVLDDHHTALYFSGSNGAYASTDGERGGTFTWKSISHAINLVVTLSRPTAGTESYEVGITIHRATGAVTGSARLGPVDVSLSGRMWKSGFLSWTESRTRDGVPVGPDRLFGVQLGSSIAEAAQALARGGGGRDGEYYTGNGTSGGPSGSFTWTAHE